MNWDLILRVVIAGLLGGLIGFEREFRAKEAGVRTHFIVALGSALFMVISQFAFTGTFDHARVAAQVVSGIGFIGGGVIIFQKNVIRGITTAAGLWVAAAIGLACGGAMYSLAIISTLLTIVCLETMHFATKNHVDKAVTVTVSPISGTDLCRILECAKSAGINVESMSVENEEVVLRIIVKQKDYLDTVKTVLSLTEGFKVDIS